MGVQVELLVNPFCMADRDSGTIGDVCREFGVSCRVLNIWDIDDDMAGLPGHLASLIREYRSGLRPGNLYSNVFVNGQRVLLDRWPVHLDEVRRLIQSMLEAEGE
ncbi:hypothetical protein LLH03_14285 [bacterium]|nr:hypothetical protein [bacterium]